MIDSLAEWSKRNDQPKYNTYISFIEIYTGFKREIAPVSSILHIFEKFQKEALEPPH